MRRTRRSRNGQGTEGERLAGLSRCGMVLTRTELVERDVYFQVEVVGRVRSPWMLSLGAALLAVEDALVRHTKKEA